MGATYSEWEEHFDKMPKAKQLKLKKALNTLLTDRMIAYHFAGTGLFRLIDFMRK